MEFNLVDYRYINFRCNQKTYDKITELAYKYNNGNRTEYLKDRMESIHVKDISRVLKNYKPEYACKILQDMITTVLSESY